MRGILVTGGAGYIGSHTAKALAMAGYEPVVLDNLSSGHRSAVKWGALVEGDVGNEALVKSTIERYRISAVIHFAANAYVGESMESPRKYFHNNVANSLKLLSAIIDCGVDRIVFSSSCATYGIPRVLPIREHHRQEPVNPYGESKRFIERTLGWYAQAHGLRSVSLRYFNAAGADPDGEIGECHNPETHLIPLAIAAALGGHAPLMIFGHDYPTADGTAVRDYIHVCDLADAHVRALNYLIRNGGSTAINLGTGRGYSVREVQNAVARISGKTVPSQVHPRRPGDPAILVANADKARRLLRWDPRYTDPVEIIETAWRWHCSQRFHAARAGY
jgi:UDP-glucose-4-epimerase GalE